MTKVKEFFKKEFVLVISVICAALSLLFVDWSPKTFISFIDWKSLAMLLSLMLVSEGLKSNGVFEAAARKLTGGNNIRILVLSLTMLPLFAAMLITNDVALITFVPLAIAALTMAGRKDLIIRVVVVQTLAANLGATITPIGDPHNLYVFVKYAPAISEWFKATLPYLPIAVIIVAIPSLVGIKSSKLDKDMTPNISAQEISEKNNGGNKKLINPTISNIIYAILFVVTFMAVLNVIDYRIVVAIVVVSSLVLNTRNIIKVDWCLLLTFVAFFIFSGNLRGIPSVNELLQSLAGEHTFWASVVASQVISNVPATIILAPFTDNWKELTIGCDVGAFGTPIASLANLISLKIYLKSEDSKAGKYMLVFTIAEVVTLVVLCLFASIVTL